MPVVGDLLGRDEEGVVGTAWSSLLACRTRSRKVGEGWRVPVGVEALAGLEKERDLEGVTVAAVAVEEVGGRCGMAPSIVEVGGVTVLAFKSSRRCLGDYNCEFGIFNACWRTLWRRRKR